MATTAMGDYDDCVVTATEVWCAAQRCAHGMMSDTRACVEDEVTAIAANDEHVYLATIHGVFAFAYVRRRNWGLEQLVGRRGRGGAPATLGPRAVGWGWGDVRGVVANASHVVIAVGRRAYALATLPTTPERVHASWTPRVCEVVEENGGCAWSEYGPPCQPRTTCARTRANVAHEDTACAEERSWGGKARYQEHEACEGIAIVRDGAVVSCVERPVCERYNAEANACEHVERPKGRRRRQVDDPCGGGEAPNVAPTASPVANNVTCGENEFVAEGECIECARCGAGMRLRQWCSRDHDTVCGDCPPNTFQPKLVHNDTQCRPTNGCEGSTRVRDGDCRGGAVPWQHTIWIAAAAYALAVGGGGRVV